MFPFQKNKQIEGQLFLPFTNREELLAGAKPRSGAELLDAYDLIFCLDWACVDAGVY